MERQHKSGWRGIWPLVCWLFLFLLLYGIRLNQKLLEQTRLYFSITLNGKSLPYPITVTWDGKPLQSGDKISLGDHHFAIIGPKTDSFSTNLFVFYGSHNLGEIRLVRSMGTLSVKASPRAEMITISGPEFATTLTNASVTNLVVPTDLYTVNAQYRHWSGSQTVSVTENEVARVSLWPRLGAVSLACNRDGATFQLQNEYGQIETGNLPDMIADLPEGNYVARAFYHRKTMKKSVVVRAGTTNDVRFEFALGAVQLESDPPGIQVHDANGNYLGRTPLLLPDLMPQTTQFNLSSSGYQPVSVTLNVLADQTNSFSTNLVNIGYESALGEARTYLAASNFEAAAQAAGAALNDRPGDADALRIQNDADGALNAERQQQERLQRPKKWFDLLCSKYRYSDLFQEHDVETSKPAADVAAAIIVALTNAPEAFKIVRTGSPEPETYEIVAQQISLLGGSERDCLIVVGQPNDVETQIRFKVLEFQIQHHFASNGLSNFHDDKRLIPIDPSRVQMNDLLIARVKEGIQIVADKIQKAIGQSPGQ